MTESEASKRPLRSSAEALTLRPVAEEDCELLWTWANDPAARAASFRSAPIPWEDHVAWFQTRLRAASSRLYLIEDSGHPVGVVRFDFEADGAAVVSINLAPEARGRRIGPVALRQACELVSQKGGIKSVIAYIKPENVASVRAFEHAHFVPAGSTAIEGSQALVLTWTPASRR